MKYVYLNGAPFWDWTRFNTGTGEITDACGVVHRGLVQASDEDPEPVARRMFEAEERVGFALYGCDGGPEPRPWESLEVFGDQYRFYMAIALEFMRTCENEEPTESR